MLPELQGNLQEDQTAALHRRASRWYARANGRGAFIGEAIRHALAAQDYALAVDLIERHALDMIMQGYARTVNGWVQAIPAKWVSQSARAQPAFAWMHLLRGACDQASPYLERLQAVLADPPAEWPAEEEAAVRAEWLVMQSLILNMRGEIAESKRAAIRALKMTPARNSRGRSLAYYAQASACRLMEEQSAAVEAYRKALRYGREAGNPIAEMLSTVGLAVMAFEHGRLQAAFELASPVSARMEQSGVPPPISTVIDGILGEIHYQWHQIEQARRHTLRALELSTMGGYNSGMILCRVVLSRLFLLEGDRETAAGEIRKAVGRAQGEVSDYVRRELASQQVRVQLACNRAAAARTTLEEQGFRLRGPFSFPEPPAGCNVPHSMGLLYAGSLHVLPYQARADGDPAALRPGIELSDRLIAGTPPGQVTLVGLEALLLRARLRTALGDSETQRSAARADYLRALELGEREGLVGIFVEQGRPVAEALADLSERNLLGTVEPGYLERILSAFGGSLRPGTARGEPPVPDHAAGTASLIEPLTEREMDVLRLMAEGLKYQEIAVRLFVSVNTVRFHVKAIYGKLDVNNRTQAIEAAGRFRTL